MDMCDSFDGGTIAKIWAKVAADGAGEAPESGEERLEEALRGFIDSAVRAAGMYELLAIKTRGSGNERELRALAAGEKSAERRLQTEYFLLTGDTYVPEKSAPSAPYLMRALRDAYTGEMENAKRYDSAAVYATGGRLRGVLLDLAGAERRHAEVLSGMVGRMIR